MFNPLDIIEVLAHNVRKTKNPFGLNIKKANTWHRLLDIKREEGEYLLFTGLMYQMIPYIEAATAQMERFEDKKLSNYTKFMKYVPSFFTSTSLDAIISKEEKDLPIEILKNITILLQSSQVDFFYREELDFYSGILLYDLGDKEAFKEHALFVTQKLKQAGIEKIITVDPHTTYALKVLYPKYLGEAFEVKTYLELIEIEGRHPQKVMLHDPCFYGRYLKLSHIPRGLLKQMEVEIEDIPYNEGFTHCCGGPAESLSPTLSKRIRDNRIKELKGNGSTVVTMCPICLANLKKSTSNIEDISSLLIEAKRSNQPTLQNKEA